MYIFRRFLKRNPNSVALFVVVIVVTMIAAGLYFGQQATREKNENRTATEGDVLVIPVAEFK